MRFLSVVRAAGTREQRATVKPRSCLGSSWLCNVTVVPYPTTCRSWTLGTVAFVVSGVQPASVTDEAGVGSGGGQDA